MSYYELMVIYSSALNEEEQRAQQLQVEELLKRENANIHLIDHWGKRKLAYTIKKQRQGLYEWTYFEVEPGRVAEIDRRLKMMEAILRFMVLRMEKIQIENLQKELSRRAEAAKVSEPQPEPAEIQAEEKVPEVAPETEPAAQPESETEVPGEPAAKEEE